MHDKRRLRVVTNSELKVSRRCSREHYFMYVLGMRSAREITALRFGGLVHEALEAWWIAAKEGARPGERLAAAMIQLGAAHDAYELARATEMLHGYTVRWSNEPLEVLAVEAEFRAPLINPESGQPSRVFELGGKLDAIVLNVEDGGTYMVEHKTSSEDIGRGSDYWSVLRLDTQVSTYYQGMRALGYEPAGCIYDVLGKPLIKPAQATPIEDRKYRQKDGALYANQRAEDETPEEYQVRVCNAIAEDPDRYFVRGSVVRLDDEEAEAQWDTWQHVQSMRDGELARRWPRNPDACRRYGRKCSFFGVCTGTESLEDAELFRHVENPHEELSL